MRRAIERVGRVVDTAGAPVVHAHVIVSGSVPIPEIALETDESGWFRLRLPPGRFTLRATAAQGSGHTETDVESDDEPILIVVHS